MKTLINLLFVVGILSSGALHAHPGGHGEMRLEIGDTQALDIVRSMTKALTFKDRGYSVGKIDESWAKVSKQQFTLVEESSSAFIFKATNPENGQTLFFDISKSGRVQSVKEAENFNKGHGHQH